MTLSRRAYSPVLPESDLRADTVVPRWQRRRLRFQFARQRKNRCVAIRVSQRERVTVDLLAWLPVSDYQRALRWYERLSDYQRALRWYERLLGSEPTR